MVYDTVSAPQRNRRGQHTAEAEDGESAAPACSDVPNNIGSEQVSVMWKWQLNAWQAKSQRDYASSHTLYTVTSKA